MKIAKVSFTANPAKLYDYLCGHLVPKAGQEIVVTVGKDDSLKIVRCVEVIEATSRDLCRPLKTIYGLITTQKDVL